MNSELWCVRVNGPDDLMATPNKDEADKYAEEMNRYWKKREPRLISFDVIPWPHSAESHAESLKEWTAERSLIREEQHPISAGDR